MGDLEPITRNEKLWSGEDLTPVTRKEMYIKHLYDETQVIPEYPVTREEMFILKAGEELHDVTIEQLTATENRTYSEEGVAYSPVIVNVPAPSVMSKNITENGDYSASDDNVYGYSSVHVAVPQTTLTTLDVSANGTYTAPSGTAYSEVDVDVPLPSNAYLLKELEDVEIATFTDGSDLPMPKLEVAIEPVQEGSGDPSPENIRPISGWDEVNVGVSGKNLWKYGDISGTKRYSLQNIDLPIANYTFSAVVTSSDTDDTLSSLIVTYDDNTNSIFRFDRGTRQSASFDTLKKIKEMIFYASRDNAKSEGDTFSWADIQLEISNQATAYEPYNGQTITIDLDGTRYGGKVDLVSGVMTVDRVGVDMGTLSWTYNTSSSLNPFFYAPIDGIKSYGAPYNVAINAMSSLYKIVRRTEAEFVDGCLCGDGTVTDILQIQVKDSKFTDASAFKTAMSGVQLVYELATPLTIQLTPTVVKSLKGKNNVYADTGNILGLSYLAKEV